MAAFFFFGPEWFRVFCLSFEFVVMIIAGFISLYSYKIFKLTSEKKYLCFNLAFLAITLSFLIRVITNTLVYFGAREKVNLVEQIRSVSFFYYGSFMIHVLLLLG
jgi:hypothetical protein